MRYDLFTDFNMRRSWSPMENKEALFNILFFNKLFVCEVLLVKSLDNTKMQQIIQSYMYLFHILIQQARNCHKCKYRYLMYKL